MRMAEPLQLCLFRLMPLIQHNCWLIKQWLDVEYLRYQSRNLKEVMMHDNNIIPVLICHLNCFSNELDSDLFICYPVQWSDMDKHFPIDLNEKVCPSLWYHHIHITVLFKHQWIITSLACAKQSRAELRWDEERERVEPSPHTSCYLYVWHRLRFNQHKTGKRQTENMSGAMTINKVRPHVCISPHCTVQKWGQNISWLQGMKPTESQVYQPMTSSFLQHPTTEIKHAPVWWKPPKKINMYLICTFFNWPLTRQELWGL